MVNGPSNLITIRRQEIETELARIAKLSEDLQSELLELDVAARVIARLSGNDSGDQSNDTGEAKSTAHNSGKPDGLPTVPEMIEMTIVSAKKEGLRGLEPKQMLARIVHSWWPEIPPNVVSSTAWRMWKGGRLKKDGQTYMLPQKKGSPTEASEPS